MLDFSFFNLFSHLAYLVLKKNISKLHMAISRSNVGNKYNLDITGAGQTHDDPHKTGAALTTTNPSPPEKNYFGNYQIPLNF